MKIECNNGNCPAWSKKCSSSFFLFWMDVINEFQSILRWIFITTDVFYHLLGWTPSLSCSIHCISPLCVKFKVNIIYSKCLANCDGTVHNKIPNTTSKSLLQIHTLCWSWCNQQTNKTEMFICFCFFGFEYSHYICIKTAMQ